MVQIRFGNNYDVADLAGKSVAEVRQQYKQEFGIPDKAQASLGGKAIKEKHEPRTVLGDNDSLTFAQKSRKGLFFIGAILLALAITGGTFAYTAISAGVEVTVTGVSEYAIIEPATTDLNTDEHSVTEWKYGSATTGTLPDLGTIWRGGIGKVTGGDLFYIDSEDYTGDLSIRLSMVNHEDLVDDYRFINLAVNLWYWDETATPPAWTQVTEATQGGIKMLNGNAYNYWLTMRQGEVIFDGLPADQYEVTIDKGSFYTYFSVTAADAPIFSCDVTQAGL